VLFVPFCGLRWFENDQINDDIATVSFTVVRAASGVAGGGAARFLFTTAGVAHDGWDLAQEFDPRAMVFVGCSLLRRGREARLPTGFSDSELPPSLPMDFSNRSHNY